MKCTRHKDIRLEGLGYIVCYFIKNIIKCGIPTLAMWIVHTRVYIDRSPVVACWASDHWVASSNPLRGKFRH